MPSATGRNRPCGYDQMVQFISITICQLNDPEAGDFSDHMNVFLLCINRKGTTELPRCIKKHINTHDAFPIHIKKESEQEQL